ncbi:hypothetical protein L2D08_23260 [Domibacillus sp. PGB-M46]|uniref:hypothetical protein n=1 Tax=Domibacillus sp. PGB-M46 TaxID=2910255 RepID=UPI001F593123|nr:hypothetical protein [Domibacillus sp. PGB-M46]MCI2257234.1 hypothetical protein [Domibacillus sp. PGB-M46]
MEKFSKIDAAIIVVVLTAFSYAITYIYQMGYQDYYNLPKEFIDLNKNTITPPLIGVFLVLIISFIFWKNTKAQFLLFIETLKVMENDRAQITIEVLRMFKNFRRYLQDFGYLLFKQLFQMTLRLVVLALIAALFVIVFKVGTYVASEKSEYMIINQETGDPYVAVAYFKDLVVVARLDVENESITPNFKTIELKELKDTEIVYFENGLKVEKVKSSQDLKE